MGYADKLLTEGEYIVYRTREHPLARLFASRWGILLVVLGLALGGVLVYLAPQPGTPRDILTWAAGILVLAGGVLIGWAYVAWWNEDYIITSRRVIKLSGILNKKTTDSSLEKINDAILEQSILGRIFDWGNLRVLTASEMTNLDYRMLHHAVEFKKVMLLAKHDLETGISRGADQRSPLVEPVEPPVGQHAATEPGASPAGQLDEPWSAPVRPTVEDKLRSLARLRDEGIISAEDYEAKKAALLEQL
jgi:uncharacterized membrane protein YdbT with pleckstrin-like domain